MTGDIRAELDRLHGAHEALAAVVRDLLLENRALKNVLLYAEQRKVVVYPAGGQTVEIVNLWPNFIAEKKRLTEEGT